MPRPPRIHIEGALYLVTARALVERRLFRDEQDYEAYLGLLREYRERMGFKLFAYVLLPDHLHLCIEPAATTTISAIMHDINSRYTKYFAHRYGHVGHLFQQRFKSTVFEKAPAVLPLGAFLHTHARRSGLAAEEGFGYSWSSYPQYVTGMAENAAPRLQVEVAEVLALLGGTGSPSYEHFVRTIPQETLEELRQDLSRPAAGSEAFLERIRALRQAAAARRPHPRATMPQEGPGPQPQPMPTPAGPRRGLVTALGNRLRRRASLFAASSIVMALAALSAAGRMEMAAHRPVAARPGSEAGGSAGPAFELASLTYSSALSGTTWDVTVRPLLSEDSAVMWTDAVHFDDGRLRSARLQEAGFADGAVRLTTKPGRWLAWEAIQADSDGRMISWRGEWDSHSTIRGTFTWQTPGQAPRRFSFVGASRLATQAAHPLSEA